MKALSTFLGVLALSAIFGLVVAQDRPAREPDPAPPGGQTAASPEREPDVQALTDLLASFVKAYNAKDANALGEWINESDDEVVFTTCKWSDDGNYLLRDFDVKIEGSIALRGTQRIAWDPQREQFRMWVFDDGGGFAEGLMARDGDRWVVQGSGVRSDGQSVSFTNAITVLDKDRLRW